MEFIFMLDLDFNLGFIPIQTKSKSTLTKFQHNRKLITYAANIYFFLYHYTNNGW